MPKSASSLGATELGLLGLIAGLVLGLGIAFLLERLDRRLKEIDDVEQAFGLPVVGHIPQRQALAVPRNAEGPERPSTEMEAFGLLRAHLRYFNVDREITTILVTSMQPGDGKTTIATHLAKAAASVGTRTLLLEADLRKPVLAERLGLKASPGLAQAIVTDEDAESFIQALPVVSSRDSDGPKAALDVLVAGAVPPNPAELLESTRMSTLLATVSDEYELVIVDAPPVSVVSDAIPILKQVEGVLLVAQLDKHTHASAVRFSATLGSLGAPVLGVVVNGLKDRNVGYWVRTLRILRNAESSEAQAILRSGVAEWRAARPVSDKAG